MASIKKRGNKFCVIYHYNDSEENADRNGKHMTRRQRQRKERKRLNIELRWESSLFQNASCSKN